jgi:hypothetical protein
MSKLLLVVLEHGLLLFFGHSLNYVCFLKLVFTVLHAFGDRKGLFVDILLLLLLPANHVVVVVVMVFQF